MKKRCFLGFLSILFSAFLSLNAFAADCAANHYTDTNGVCTPCPANSHSNGRDTLTCTCDDGYSLNGDMTDPSDQETTTTDCQIKRYGVAYWINRSGSPDRDIRVPHNETFVLLTAEEGKTMSENRGTWPGEGYIIEKWRDRNSEVLFLPGAQVDKNDVPTGHNWLELVAVFGCAAGYYGDGNTCTICPAGSYCPGDGQSYVCPENQFCPDGAAAATPCPVKSSTNGATGQTFCVCDAGHSLTGLSSGGIETTDEECKVITYTVTYAVGNVYKVDNVEYGQPYTFSTSEYWKGDEFAQTHWKGSGRYDYGKLFAMGETITYDFTYELYLKPVYGCAAGYYGDGTTCTACPEHSTSDIGADYCTCDTGYGVGGVLGDTTTRGDACVFVTVPFTYYPVKGAHGLSSLRDYTGYYEDYTVVSGVEKFPAYSEGYVFDYWVNMNDESKKYYAGDVISGDMIGVKGIAVYGVWHCAAGYYADGTTCTPCPANSHSDAGATVCTCDEGYSLNGNVTDPSDQETTTTDCQIMKYSVWYWMPPKSGPPDIYDHQYMPYTQSVNLLTSDKAKEMVSSQWPGEGYKIKKWVEYIGMVPTDRKFDPDELVTVDDLSEGQSALSLVAEFECTDGYRMEDNVCEPCPNGLCVNPAPLPPTCPDGYHVEESTNKCVGNTLYIKFENGGSYNYEVSDLPTGLSVTHGKPVPVLSDLATIGPDMRYREDADAGTAEMDVRNWAFDLDGYDVTAWHADGSVDIGSMGDDPEVSTILFPESGDLEVYPVWRTIALRCNAGYYNPGEEYTGPGNCVKCPTTGNKICPGMDESEPTGAGVESGIKTCGANSSPNDAHTECVCNAGYAPDTITGTCTEKTYTIEYDDDTVDLFKHFDQYTIRTPDARDGYVFEYWVDNNGAQYTAGQTISGSDLTDIDITLTGVWHCAADYYADGTTCKACPEHSTSTEGSDYCTCDMGYTVGGRVNGATTTTDQACSIKTYIVNYYLSSSMPTCTHDVTYANSTVQYWNRDNQGLAHNGRDASCGNPLAAKGEGYKIVAWRPKNSVGIYYSDAVSPDAVIDDAWVESHLGYSYMLHLYPEYACAAGYYGDGNTCTICPKGSYCPGDGRSYACPDGYTADDGATEQRKCYLRTEPGNWVDSAGAQQRPCPKGSYCPGGVPVYYGDTGGKRSCPPDYPYSGAGSVKVDDCYKNCWDTPVENGTAHPEAPTAHHPTDCTYSMGTSTLKNPCNIITKDDGNMFCYESNCPYDQEMKTPGICTECNVKYAETYDENATGNCIVKTCLKGYMPYLNECREEKISCYAEHATKAHRHWDEKYLAYGPCLVEDCEENYHIDANACESDISPCYIKNGVGERVWEESNWSACYVKQCERGFKENADGTKCERCDNYYDEKGEIAVSSYIDKCEIATCMYQGEKYILKDDECSLICTDVDNDGTGSRHWNEETQKCERTCNEGFLPW